jgi:hypothetical protein
MAKLKQASAARPIRTAPACAFERLAATKSCAAATPAALPRAGRGFLPGYYRRPVIGVQLGVDGTGRRDYSWSAEVWRVFFDEWAGIVECDGGLPHAKAEAQAFACCVVAWNAPTVRANGNMATEIAMQVVAMIKK